MDKSLSIIIVNYNVKHFLEQTLTSVFKALDKIDAEVFVVDNNSIDGSCELVLTKFPKVKLISNKKNIGFSSANNQAIRIATGKYVLLLNPDTVVEEDTFVKCIHFMDSHLNCGGLGIKMVDGSGVFLPESKRGLPIPTVAFYKIFGLAKLFPNSKRFGQYHLTYLDKDKTHKVDVLSGAFMFMRKEALDKSGLLDEDFFMYGEDIDLSYRLTKAGYDNYYLPDTRIIHYKGESTKKSSVNYVFVFYNAMIIFARKHFSSSNAGFFTLLIKFAIYLKASSTLISNFIKSASWIIFDIASIFGGMFFLKTYWEKNHKWVPGSYPPEYMLIVVPSYILIWLLSTYLSGGYDKPFKFSKVVRGILIGFLAISAISNFVDAYRFSKALIILGSGYAIFSFLISRLTIHFFKYGNFSIDSELEKKVALIGSKEEVERIEKILQETGKVDIIGHIYMDDRLINSDNSLGKVSNLSELTSIYRLNELIFCAKDIPAHQIIDWMVSIKNPDIEYKIVPDDSNFIIGSSSKNTTGDYYAFDIELKINKKENRRKKRVLDIVVSSILIIIFPLLLFTRRKFLNLSDSFSILFGNKSWVSTNDAKNSLDLKQGIFTPNSLQKNSLESNTIQRLNMLYAKNYSPSMDLEIIIGCL